MNVTVFQSGEASRNRLYNIPHLPPRYSTNRASRKRTRPRPHVRATRNHTRLTDVYKANVKKNSQKVVTGGGIAPGTTEWLVCAKSPGRKSCRRSGQTKGIPQGSTSKPRVSTPPYFHKSQRMNRRASATRKNVSLAFLCIFSPASVVVGFCPASTNAYSTLRNRYCCRWWHNRHTGATLIIMSYIRNRNPCMDHHHNNRNSAQFLACRRQVIPAAKCFGVLANLVSAPSTRSTQQSTHTMKDIIKL